MDDLQKEYEYYLAHLFELAEKYSGKFLAIKGQEVVGVYESDLEAVQTMSRSHELGTFLIQFCDPAGERQTQTYHSRASFAQG